MLVQCLLQKLNSCLRAIFHTSLCRKKYVLWLVCCRGEEMPELLDMQNVIAPAELVGAFDRGSP